METMEKKTWISGMDLSEKYELDVFELSHLIDSGLKVYRGVSGERVYSLKDIDVDLVGNEILCQCSVPEEIPGSEFENDRLRNEIWRECRLNSVMIVEEEFLKLTGKKRSKARFEKKNI